MKNKNRKILWILPLLVLPVLTLLFWLWQQWESSTGQPGQELNISLPQAHTDQEKPRDKMSYYEQAEKDSVQWQKQLKNDPYYRQVPDQNAPERMTGAEQRQEPALFQDQDPNEQKVYEKLASLKALLQEPADTLPSSLGAHPSMPSENATTLVAGDIDRLEMMMEQMTRPQTEDPELRQLDHMLQTILDIQHPERVQEKLAQVSRENKGQVFPVTAMPREDPVSLLEDNKGLSQGEVSGFYGLEPLEHRDTLQNAVAAVIHQTQEVVAGSTVKLRLTQDIYIEGVHIPKGHFVFGTAGISGERLDITIDGIRYQNALFPVELQAYSMDGMQGLHIPGAISRKVAKESAGQAVQGLGITSFDTSLEAQVASAGVEATRSLFAKKAKRIKVTVKAGDPVLLKDNKQKNY